MSPGAIEPVSRHSTKPVKPSSRFRSRTETDVKVSVVSVGGIETDETVSPWVKPP